MSSSQGGGLSRDGMIGGRSSSQGGELTRRDTGSCCGHIGLELLSYTKGSILLDGSSGRTGFAGFWPNNLDNIVEDDILRQVRNDARYRGASLGG